MDELFNDKIIREFCESLSVEFSNRNLFPYRDYSRFIYKNPKTDFGKKCSSLFLNVRNKISNDELWGKLIELKSSSQAVATALFMADNKGDYDRDKVAINIAASLIQEKMFNLDIHVEKIGDTGLCDELGITINKDGLVNLSDTRLLLKKQGIVFNEVDLIYPHQFFRRYYSSNFVGMPALLSKSKSNGLDVSLRIDPLRRTEAKNYLEVMELDHWHGPPFSDEILINTHVNTRTVHVSRGVDDLNYDPRYTVFRTKMMDKNIREFMIEEYCPTELIGGRKSPGVGDKYVIQKFAHVCFDQGSNLFTHLDGAVRIFEISEYREFFSKIETGNDVDEKIGARHKMFLVEGEFDRSLAEDLLTEWFRYNSHIQEYFSNVTIEPAISYEKLREISS